MKRNNELTNSWRTQLRWPLMVICLACCSFGWKDQLSAQQKENPAVTAFDPQEVSIRLKLAPNTPFETATSMVAMVRKFGINQVEIAYTTAGQENEMVILAKPNLPIERIGGFIAYFESNAKSPIKIHYEVVGKNDSAKSTLDLEERSLALAKELQAARSAPSGSNASELDRITAQLSQIVEQAFDARLQKQKMDLAAHKQRLRTIEEAIEVRERNRKQIIERRINELQDPNMQWQPTSPMAPEPLQGQSEDGRYQEAKKAQNANSSSKVEQSKWLQSNADYQPTAQPLDPDSPLAIRERLIRCQEMVAKLNESLTISTIPKDEREDLVRRREKNLMEFRFNVLLWKEKLAELKSELNLRQNESALAKKEYQRAQELYKKGALPQSGLESNKLQVERANMEEQRARSNLSLYEKAGEGIDTERDLAPDSDLIAAKRASGESQGFEVMQLQKLDPQLAIATVRKFFGLVDGERASATGLVIDGNLAARQLWVKGTVEELQKVRDLVMKLEDSCALAGIVTYKGKPLTGKLLLKSSLGGETYSVPVDDTGKFEVKIPYGKYQVAFVSKLSDTPKEISKYQLLETSGITIEVDQAKESLNIELPL